MVQTDSNTEFIRHFTPQFMCILFLTLSQSVIGTYLTVVLAQQGISTFAIGCLHSAYYLGILFGSLLLKKQVCSWGHYRSYLIFAVLGAISIALPGWVFQIWFWIIMRLIFGICLACLTIISESWLLAHSESAIRDRLIAAQMVIMYIAQPLGQGLWYALNSYNLLLFIISATFCLFSIVPLMLFPSRLTFLAKKTTRSQLAYSHPLIHLGVWGSFYSGLILSATFSFIPYFAIHNHYNVFLLAQVTLLGSILQWPIGWLVDKYCKRNILKKNIVAILLFACMILLWPNVTPLVYFSSLMLGTTVCGLYRLTFSMACAEIKDEDLIDVNVVLLLSYTIGCAISPLLVAMVLQYTSSAFLFGYVAIVAAIFGLIEWRLHK